MQVYEKDRVNNCNHYDNYDYDNGHRHSDMEMISEIVLSLYYYSL